MPSQVLIADALVLVRSLAADSGVHAHRALQLVWSVDTPIEVDLDGDTRSTQWAVLAPMQAHRLRGSGQRLAHLFLDPGPAPYRRWLRAQTPCPPSGDLAGQLAEWCSGGCGRKQAGSLARAWLVHSLPGLVATRCPDERIARTLDRLDADPVGSDAHHRRLAAQVDLSPSRFQALFRAHTGQSVQQYVLWRRLLRALERLTEGDSVTRTAADTGFADAAHLSRSFRKVVGAAPSEIRPLD